MSGFASGALADLEHVLDDAAWEEAVDNLDGEIDDIPSLPLPTRSLISLAPASTSTAPAPAPAPEAAAGGKRKAPASAKGGKKAKLADGSAAPDAAPSDGVDDAAAAAAGPAGGFESVFSAEMLLPPKLLSAKEVEKVLVERQKRMLLDEYGVEGEGEEAA